MTRTQGRARDRALNAALVTLVAGALISCSSETSHPQPGLSHLPDGDPSSGVVRAHPDAGQQAGAAPVTAGLLHAAAGGDGDSWHDTAGREYRLGLVNTPEYNQCYGAKATSERKRLVADGFRARVYTTDRYGRRVAVVTTAGGANLNLYLARHGFADDRYLQRFRSENPQLANELDVAFRAAKAERAGLWRACR